MRIHYRSFVKCHEYFILSLRALGSVSSRCSGMSPRSPPESEKGRVVLIQNFPSRSPKSLKFDFLLSIITLSSSAKCVSGPQLASGREGKCPSLNFDSSYCPVHINAVSPILICFSLSSFSILVLEIERF